MRPLRGRPRHNDVLTPREWEVLSLLREGLTNEQIALRLNITFDTAKFHVSEILGKLGVETRQEAAAWGGQPRGVPAPAATPSVWQRAGLTSPVRVFAATVIATVAVGMLALAGGLLLMNTRDGEEPAAAGSDGRTGDEALDALIDSVLSGDAASLASRFAGVTAREGGVIGGPVGIFDVRQVSDIEWTARLAGAPKTLHAVVQDPREPFAWWDQPASSMPRAAILDAERDFDVVLIVDEDSSSNPWRLSIVDGRVIDVVIDNGLQTPFGERAQGPLARRLGYLTPSPDDEADSFLIRPDERNVPPPPRRRPAGGRAQQAPPAPVSERSTAPNGRTGDTSLDAVIDQLLRADERTLRARYDRLPALDEETGARVPASDWTNTLASASRSLYAAYTSDPLEAEIVLDVSTAAGVSENWKFGVEDGEVVEVTLRSRSLPPLDREYARFYVVPSLQAGPQQPANHSLSLRSGDQDVDRLLAILQARDASALEAALAAPGELVVRDGEDCGRGAELHKDAAFAAAWAADTSAKAHGIHAVIAVPQGYQPPGDHLVILITKENPFSWKAVGLLERQGRVVLVITAGCGPERLYPPTHYVVPPPVGGLNAVSQSRRSSIAVVDAVLNAAATGNETAMAGLISYRPTPCRQPEIGVLPCPPGTATGTVLNAISISACHGGYALPAEAPKQLIEIANAGLYAVIEPQPSSLPPGAGTPVEAETRIALLYSPVRGAVAITIGAQGVTEVRSGCFVRHPEWLVDNAQPEFLLPPP